MNAKIAEKIERNGTKPVIDAAKRNKKLFLRPCTDPKKLDK